MKKFIYIITVFWVLALIMSSTSGCDRIASTDEALEEYDQAYNAIELIEACEQGNLEDVKRLIEQDVQVDVVSNDGWTALMIAVDGGYTEIVNILIKNGAHVNFKNDNES